MSFTQGVSGLNAANSSLDTIGNNIANSQTIGFKSGRSEFADIYAGAKTGLGAQVTGVTQNFSGGALNGTGRALDVAIDGGGFFRLTDGSQTLYSRNGQFQQTKDGYIANAQGARLTGYNVSNFNNPGAEATVAAGGNPVPLKIPTERMNAKATSEASLEAALDAGAEIKSGPFNANDAESYNWSTPNTVFDSLGNAHSVNLYFSKTDVNEWQVNGEMTLGEEAALPKTVEAGTNYEGFDPVNNGNGSYAYTSGSGHDYTAYVSGAMDNGDGTFSGGQITYVERLPATTLSFDANGNLNAAQQPNKAEGLSDSSVAYSLDSKNGSAPIDFSFNFGGSSQTAQQFSASTPQQNGYVSGDLTGITVEQNGMVRGSYSNGQAINLGQVILAGFRNEQGLTPVGNNAWVETAESGQPGLGTAGTGQFGSMLSSTLESSNVDLSQQLVEMIIAQRNYQANAQTIKTQDQVLQTAVNLR